MSGGYADSIGTPSASLRKEIEFVDTEIGQMLAELKSQHLRNSKLIIITAKYRQPPSIQADIWDGRVVQKRQR